MATESLLRFIKHSVRRIVIAVLLPVCLVLYCFTGGGRPKWLVPIPSGHDENLVGIWEVTWRPSFGTRKTRLYLFEDGTGITRDNNIEWGTDQDQIAIRFRTESWSKVSQNYQVNPKTGEVTFSGKDGWYFPARMMRYRPLSSVKTLGASRGTADYEKALQLANERKNFVSSALNQLNSGFRNGPKGSRQWFLFPIAMASPMVCVNFSTEDGSVFATKWTHSATEVRKQWQVQLVRGSVYYYNKWNPETGLSVFLKAITGDYLVPDETSPDHQNAENEFENFGPFVSFEADPETHQVVAGIHSESEDWTPHRYTDVVADQIAVIPEELRWVAHR